ncbi:MAG TPA: hypothetical protein VIN07_12200 [Flavipsychrobacter sp.]
MRYLLIALLTLLHPMWANAQKHSVYVDLGIPAAVSATYNYKLTKNLGAGGGLQGYTAYLPYERYSKFVPTVFADIRLTAWATKKNRLISFIDLGMNLHKKDQGYRRDSTTIYNIPHNNSFCTGLGLGYFRRFTKRGGGGYITLKMLMNWHNLKEYSIVADSKDRSLIVAGITPVLSIGFKF